MNNRLPGPDVTTDQLRNRSWWTGPELYMLVDDYDLVAGSGGNPLAPLVDLLPQARDIGLHLILTRRAGGAGRAPVRAGAAAAPGTGRPRPADVRQPGRGRPPRPVKPGPQPPGRGYLVRRSDGMNLIQTAFIEPR